MRAGSVGRERISAVRVMSKVSVRVGVRMNVSGVVKNERTVGIDRDVGQRIAAAGRSRSEWRGMRGVRRVTTEGTELVVNRSRRGRENVERVGL